MADDKKPLGTTAKTGEVCPESGVWKVVGTPSTTAPIAKHNRMPPYAGSAVTWKLIQYALRGAEINTIVSAPRQGGLTICIPKPRTAFVFTDGSCFLLTCRLGLLPEY
jgi:hypothetical protein